MNKGKDKITVLHLPKWYPNIDDEQNGVFIEKHIESTSYCANSIVIFVLSTKSIKKRFEIVSDTSQSLIVIKGYFKPNSFLNPILYIITFLKAVQKVDKLGSPDIIHAHVGFRTYLIGAVLKRILHIPFVVTEHWSGYGRGVFNQFSALKKWIIKKALRRVDGISYVSSKLEDQISSCGLKLDSKKVIIPNVIESCKQQKVEANKFPVLLVVSDLKDGIKNVSGILNSIAQISDAFFELRIVGDGDDRVELENMAKDLQLKQTVNFLGRRDNSGVYEQLVQCDFLISNSRTETFGMVPLEALACGKPVVCTRTGCPPEIQDDKYGIFVESDNPKMLKEAIELMLKTYMNYNTEELKLVAKNYSSEKVGEMFKKLYDSVLLR